MVVAAAAAAAAASATAARLRTAGVAEVDDDDAPAVDGLSADFGLCSNGVPVLRAALFDDEAELSDVLESVLADRADFGTVVEDFDCVW